MNNALIANRYAIHRKIGEGSFGEIYSGEDTETHTPVAIKLEPVKSRAPQLEFESKVYNILNGGTGIPKMHWYGHDSQYNILIMDMLDHSIEDLHLRVGGRLSLKTVYMLADQMISCIEYMHRCHLIHRDIKPDNFMLGIGSHQNQVYVIDYGLSKRFEDPLSHRHIPPSQAKSLTGTARYASLNAMRGFEQSRRDDMESLGFVFMYLLRGNLPWMGLPAKTQSEKFRKITDVKGLTSLEDLCAGYPPVFKEYLTICRELKFTEEPPYSTLRQLFRQAFIDSGFIYDGVFDWTPASQRREIKPFIKKTSDPVIPSGLPPCPDLQSSTSQTKDAGLKPVEQPVQSPSKAEAFHRGSSRGRPIPMPKMAMPPPPKYPKTVPITAQPSPRMEQLSSGHPHEYKKIAAEPPKVRSNLPRMSLADSRKASSRAFLGVTPAGGRIGGRNQAEKIPLELTRGQSSEIALNQKDRLPLIKKPHVGSKQVVISPF